MVLLLLLALACRSSTAQPTQAQIESGVAAAYNVDIIINSDLFTNKPEMLSGGLGFTNIVGVSDTTDEQVVRAAGGAWNTGLTCSDPAYQPVNRVITSSTPTTVWLQG